MEAKKNKHFAWWAECLKGTLFGRLTNDFINIIIAVKPLYVNIFAYKGGAI